MIGRFSKHAAVYASAPSGSEWRPITEEDFTYTGSYSLTPFGEVYLTSSGTLHFNSEEMLDFCVVGGGGGGGRSSAQTSTSNRAQTGGGAGGGGVVNVFNVSPSADFNVTCAAACNQRTDGNESRVFGGAYDFRAYGGRKGVDGAASNKKSGDGGKGGTITINGTSYNGGSGGGGGSYGPNQVGGAGGTNGANGVNGTTNNASAGTPGNGGGGGGIDCHCFTEEWNTLFGSGGQGGSGNVTQAGADGANYRGNGGGGGSTTYNFTTNQNGGGGGSGVVVVRFHCEPRPVRPTSALFSMFPDV